MSKFKLTQTATEVQDILNNSLQKPTGLAKTELVGVGVNGQENIEIGDNLTLANGKLSAATSGGGSTEKLYKHNVSVSSNAYGNVRITFYNYNDVAVNSEKKLKTAIQSTGRLTATGYIKNGSSVYNVHGVYFQPSENKVYAIGYKADANSGNVSTTEVGLNDSFSFSDDVRAVS